MLKRLLCVLALAAFVLVGCGGGDDGGGDATSEGAGNAQEAQEDAGTQGGGTVTVGATEFAFSMEETLPAGETEFVLQNNGEQKHELSMVQLKENAPAVEKLLKLPRNKVEKYFVSETGHAMAGPGEEASFSTTLAPGRYAYVCFVQDPKSKKPHAMLGMYGELTVE